MIKYVKCENCGYVLNQAEVVRYCNSVNEKGNGEECKCPICKEYKLESFNTYFDFK